MMQDVDREMEDKVEKELEAKLQKYVDAYDKSQRLLKILKKKQGEVGEEYGGREGQG